MDNNYGKRFFNSFIKAFAILFLILVVFPLLLDQIIYSITGGMGPSNDSIKVFKDLVGSEASISEFIQILKKIIIFM